MSGFIIDGFNGENVVNKDYLWDLTYVDGQKKYVNVDSSGIFLYYGGESIGWAIRTPSGFPAFYNNSDDPESNTWWVVPGQGGSAAGTVVRLFN
jgi:hypothetical protein